MGVDVNCLNLRVISEICAMAERPLFVKIFDVGVLSLGLLVPAVLIFLVM